MKRKISSTALEKLKQLEGCRLKAYKDEAGILTIGYGHTSQAGCPFVTENSIITRDEADNILKNDLAQYEEQVAKHVTVPLSDAKFDALVLFCYNIGIKAFCKSTVLRKINAQAYDAVPQEWLKWSNIKGNLSTGLLHRRSVELLLWNTNNVPIKNRKNNLEKIIALIAPLGGIITALTNMIAQSFILQIALVMFVIPAGLMSLFYYYKYNRRIL